VFPRYNITQNSSASSGCFGGKMGWMGRVEVGNLATFKRTLNADFAIRHPITHEEKKPFLLFLFVY